MYTIGRIGMYILHQQKGKGFLTLRASKAHSTYIACMIMAN